MHTYIKNCDIMTERNCQLLGYGSINRKAIARQWLAYMICNNIGAVGGGVFCVASTENT
jgi:hypothetical protein